MINNFKDYKYKASPMEPYSSSAGLGTSSSKRARTPSSGVQIVSCLVDGCKSDLSKCREYHRRHKVCEMHSKSPKVTIVGREQRFCQQCSRFHSLEEFDEGKRSCRKRLEGHNKRRRKPQPETLPINHTNFLSATQGSRFMEFSNQPIISGNPVVSSTNWSGALKSESYPPLYNNSLISNYKARQFPFLEGQPENGDNNNNNNNNSNNNGQKMLFNGLNQVIHTDRALSLLSSSSPETSSEFGLGRIIQPNLINPVWPMISGLHYHGIGPGGSV